jgi:endonuclease-3 related protein
MYESRRDLLRRLYDALESAYGPMRWWPADTPFEVCAGAILTQNAPWDGVVKAIRALKELGVFSAEGIADADVGMIAAAIRPTVYYNQKARRLKTFCEYLLAEHDGGIEEMRRLELPEARQRLLAMSGIGYETADSMLLYALGMPVFVVDAYTCRILFRHGLADENWGYEETREFFESALEPDVALYNEFHALLCHLGAVCCKSKPDCAACPARAALGEPVS